MQFRQHFTAFHDLISKYEREKESLLYYFRNRLSDTSVRHLYFQQGCQCGTDIGEMRFTECLKAAIREIKTYGETDLEKIASCYAKMAYNNFSPAAEGIKISEKECVSLMPFEGYDEYRKENGEYILYRLKEESKHVENLRNAYDKCLFCAVRNVLNRDRDAIVNSKKLYT